MNGGFEAVDDNGLVGWRKHGGLLSQVAEPARSGAGAAAFFSTTAGTKWVFQPVAVTPTAWYELEGYVLHEDPHVEAAWLRVSWYASVDGSGRALTTVDSTEVLEAPAAGYRFLTTGPVRAPPNARSASARILLRPRSEISALVYIDDVSFVSAAAPVAAAPAVAAVPAPPAPAKRAPAGGATARGSGAAPASSHTTSSSDVLGVRQQNAEPVPMTPQPVPVRVRNALRTPANEPSAGGFPWRLWALAAGLTLGAFGLAEWRVRRARRA